MVKISITNKDVGYVNDAVSWCMKHLKSGVWALDPQWPQDELVFTFDNQEDASHFCLKWLQ